MGAAIRDAADLSGERSRTELSLIDNASTGALFQVDISNSGNTAVSTFDKMDVIVNYKATSNQATVTTRLDYVDTTAAPDNNEWTDATTTPNLFQPGIWDPGETLTLDTRLSPQRASGTSGVIHVSTPNGVVVSGAFSNP